MSDQTNDDLQLIFRCMTKDPDTKKYQAILELFLDKEKEEINVLDGWVMRDSERIPIRATIREPKDKEKQNFLSIYEISDVGDGTVKFERELGFGNAINNRQDNEPVYYDQMVFSLINKNNENYTIFGRLVADLNEELTHKLGFKELKKERPLSYSSKIFEKLAQEPETQDTTHTEEKQENQAKTAEKKKRRPKP